MLANSRCSQCSGKSNLLFTFTKYVLCGKCAFLELEKGA